MMHIGYDKTKDFFSPFLKGVPERERGGGILKHARNTNALNFLQSSKIPLSCAQMVRVYFYVSMRTIHSPFKKGENFIDTTITFSRGKKQ
jgi:hypothetical protein